MREVIFLFFFLIRTALYKGPSSILEFTHVPPAMTPNYLQEPDLWKFRSAFVQGASNMTGTICV